MKKNIKKKVKKQRNKKTASDKKSVNVTVHIDQSKKNNKSSSVKTGSKGSSSSGAPSIIFQPPTPAPAAAPSIIYQQPPPFNQYPYQPPLPPAFSADQTLMDEINRLHQTVPLKSHSPVSVYNPIDNRSSMVNYYDRSFANSPASSISSYVSSPAPSVNEFKKASPLPVQFISTPGQINISKPNPLRFPSISITDPASAFEQPIPPMSDQLSISRSRVPSRNEMGISPGIGFALSPGLVMENARKTSETPLGDAVMSSIVENSRAPSTQEKTEILPYNMEDGARMSEGPMQTTLPTKSRPLSRLSQTNYKIVVIDEFYEELKSKNDQEVREIARAKNIKLTLGPGNYKKRSDLEQELFARLMNKLTTHDFVFENPDSVFS
jgi:hypothetical protein